MRIEKINRLSGEVVKTFNSIENAAKEAGVSVTTVKRQLNGSKTQTYSGWTWRYVGGKRPGKTRKEYYESLTRGVALVNNDDDAILKKYISIKEASEDTGISRGYISNLLAGRSNMRNFGNKKGFYFIWITDKAEELKKETKEEPKEIVKPEREEYYINILVGLVNRTLVDRAIYNIRGIDYTYIKEHDVLIGTNGEGNVTPIKRDFYCEMCKIQLPLLNSKEREFLTNLLKAFNDVKGIQKSNDIFDGFEFLRIVSNSPTNNMDLPKFRAGEYYSNLELDRLYTLEELDI